MAMVEVNVDLGDFEDDELIEELEDRGYTIDKDEEDDDDEVPKHRENECLLHTLSSVVSTATNSAPTWRTSPDVAVTSATKNY